MDKEYLKLLELENEYRITYNTLSEKNSPHEAVSNFVQIKSGVEDQLKAFDQQTLHILERKKEMDEESFRSLFSETLTFLADDLDLFERHFQAINKIIRIIIGTGYPSKLKVYTTQEIEETAMLSNLGRPLDSTAPQELIVEKVKELASKKEFQTSNGRPKPTTIRDYIQNNHIELQGELSSRALFDRVKKALEELDMQ